MLHIALKLIRSSHDLSQKELAQKLGISKSYLSEIESRKKTPSLALLESYGQVFQVPVSSILFLVENFDCPPQKRNAPVSLKVLVLFDLIAQRSRTSNSIAHSLNEQQLKPKQ